MVKPIIVQHSFGEMGTGGPVGALDRLLGSESLDAFEVHRMHQSGSLGGIDLPLLRDWVAYLRELRPDLIHVRGLGNEGFHGAFAARMAGVERILVSVHGTHRDLQMPRGPQAIRSIAVRRGLEPATLGLATHIATVCEYAASRPFIARRSEKFVGVVPNGVDLPRLDPRARASSREALSIPQDAFVMAFAGRINREKGLGDLATALKQLDPSWLTSEEQRYLIIMGEGPHRQEIEREFQTVSSVGVRFLGLRLDVPTLLLASDLFLFPSWQENLPNALLEAMAAGLPSIASDVGGNTELLQGGAGVLVPRKAPDALAGAIDRLVHDASWRMELGSTARGRVASRYTTRHMAAGWSDMYARLLA